MKKVYICSPLKGKNHLEESRNRMYAREWSIIACELGYLPICPHIYLESATKLSEQEDRKKLLKMAIELMIMCDEVWVCTERISEGMKREIEIAKNNGIKIKEVWRI